MLNFRTIITIIIVSFLCVSSMLAQDETWFTEITEDIGLGDLRGNKMQVVDLNGDNYPELIFGSPTLPSQGHSSTFTVFLNQEDPNNPGQRIFVDITEESGINVNRDPNRHFREYDIAVFGDVDNDGDPDLITSFYYHRLEYFQPGHPDRPEVYLNDGNCHFTLMENNGLFDAQYHHSLPAGVLDGVGIAFFDYDYDGIVDLYLATKFVDYQYGINFPDIIMKGNGDGSFTMYDDEKFYKVPDPLYGVNITDWNNDGWQDVITSPYCRSGGKLLKNNGDGTFDNVADEANYSAQHMGGDWTVLSQSPYQEGHKPLCQWECPTADFDNDGDMDLLQIEVHGGYEENEGRSHIAINGGPPDYRYEWDLSRITRDASSKAHLGDYGGLWCDWDNDGWLDISICEGYYTEYSRRLYMCKQDETHYFDDVTAELGLMYILDAHSIEAADFDLDGDNDIFVAHTDRSDGSANGKVVMRVLRNDIANNSNWISVKTDAPEGANQSGFGTRITVCSGDLKQIREIQAGLGHFGGQQPFIRNFGLGQLNRVDSIMVRWPMKGAPVTTIYNPPINMIIEIDENGMKEDFVQNWQGEVPVLAFSKALAFYDTINVDESAEVTLDIENRGSAALEISAIDFNNPEGPFSFKSPLPDMPFSIAPGGKVSVTVVFAPEARSDFFEGISISSNAFNGSLRGFDLVGWGYSPAPIIAVNQSVMTFQEVNPTATQQLVISNNGQEAFSIDDIVIEDDDDEVFSYAGFEGSQEVAPGSDFVLDVIFSPIYRDEYTASLHILSDAYNEQETVISLLGSGDVPTPEISLSKPYLNFRKVPINSYKDETIDIENEGDGDLIITGFTTEEFQGIYTYVGELPLTIPGETTVPVTLRFSPLEKIDYDTKLFISNNSFNLPEKELKLRGEGDDEISVDEEITSDRTATIKVSPNPCSGSSVVTYRVLSGSGQNINVYLSDMFGKKLSVLESQFRAPGEYSLALNVPNLSSGKYFLVLETEGGAVRYPLVIVD